MHTGSARRLAKTRGGLIALAALLAVGTGASCAVVSGLDAYSSGPCQGPCDKEAGHSSGPADATLDSLAVESGDEEQLSSTGDGAGRGEDADALDDAGDAAPAEAGSADSGEGGCDTTTVENCGACGVACSASTGTPACHAGTCSYACNAGRSDCNATTAPDTDGCECAGSGCCPKGCQTAHGNGAGQSYYDCADAGTIDKTQATEACAAFTGDAGGCMQGQTNCGCAGFCSPTAQSVCGASGGMCRCWQYAGPAQGTVQSQQTTGGTYGCRASCGSTSDPTWN